MDISETQLRSIQSWALHEPFIKEVYLFGSRAKGTSRPDSDVDIAIAFAVPHDRVESVFLMNGEYWQDDLRAKTGLVVNLAHLAGDRTPKHTAAVADHGILLYPL